MSKYRNRALTEIESLDMEFITSRVLFHKGHGTMQAVSCDGHAEELDDIAIIQS